MRGTLWMLDGLIAIDSAQRHEAAQVNALIAADAPKVPIVEMLGVRAETALLDPLADPSLSSGRAVLDEFIPGTRKAARCHRASQS